MVKIDAVHIVQPGLMLNNKLVNLINAILIYQTGICQITW